MAVHLLQVRRAQYAVGFAVWVSIVVIGALVAWARPSLIVVADVALLIVLLVLLDGGASIYKLALWLSQGAKPARADCFVRSNVPEEVAEVLDGRTGQARTRHFGQRDAFSEKED